MPLMMLCNKQYFLASRSHVLRIGFITRGIILPKISGGGTPRGHEIPISNQNTKCSFREVVHMSNNEVNQC